jgi:GTP-binding protein
VQIHDARFIASARTIDALPPPLFFEVAFAGRSNVGKSSLINRLLNRRKLVRTSGTPGCTRGIDLYRVQISEATVDFVDLPGYGYSKRSKAERFSWGPLIDNYLRARENLRTVVVIVDLRRGIQEEDRQLLDFLVHLKRSTILVATKIDKLPLNRQKTELSRLRKEFACTLIGFSAETGAGRDALFKALLEQTVDGRIG